MKIDYFRGDLPGNLAKTDSLTSAVLAESAWWVPKGCRNGDDEDSKADDQDENVFTVPELPDALLSHHSMETCAQELCDEAQLNVDSLLGDAFASGLESQRPVTVHPTIASSSPAVIDLELEELKDVLADCTAHLHYVRSSASVFKVK